MAGKLSPEGEWSSGITPPPNPLENGPPGSPSSCLIQVSPTAALVIVQQPGQRLFGAHSVLIQGSARDTEAQGELLQLWPRPWNRVRPPADPGRPAPGSSSFPGLTQKMPGSSCKHASFSGLRANVTGNSRFFVHLIMGGQEGSNRREELEKSPRDAGIRGFMSPPVTESCK